MTGAEVVVGQPFVPGHVQPAGLPVALGDLAVLQYRDLVYLVIQQPVITARTPSGS
jgi:hypothetical protein